MSLNSKTILVLRPMVPAHLQQYQMPVVRMKVTSEKIGFGL